MKRVVFLGAGASNPFFNPALTTRYLTNQLADGRKVADIVRRFNRLMQDTNEIDPSLLSQTISKIISLNQDANFEQIIEIVDKIASYNFDPGNDSKTFHTLLKFLGVGIHTYANHCWDDVPFVLRQIVAESITELQRRNRVPDYPTLVKNQEGFFEHLLKTGTVAIHSLNYDEVTLDSIANIGIVTGFTNSQFEVGTLMSAPNTICFPHGHVRFVMNDKGVRYYDSGTVANEERLKNLPTTTLGRTESVLDSSYCYNFNTFIVTGQTKESTFDNNPYAAYYQKLAIDIAQSEEIVIVGYSLSDAHFNRMLLNFLPTSPQKKVILVCMMQQNIDVIADFVTPTSLVHRILSTLGFKTIPLDSAAITYPYQEEIDKLNATGYGMLYPQIYVFKDGYASFLSRYSELV